MKIDKLKERLKKERPMTTISLRMPQDVVEDLKRIAPHLGFSGYQPLMRTYIGQGLRKDLVQLEQTPEVANLLESLRRHGVADEVIASAVAEVKLANGKHNRLARESAKPNGRLEQILAEEGIDYDPAVTK